VKYTSALITDARNKLGGDVFARNRAGLYVRVKIKPKNPQTTIQQSNRANFSTLTKGFRSLTSAQIAGWNTLAGSSTLTDTLGNSYAPSGLQLFIGLNRNLYLMGFSSITDPPQSKPSFAPIIVPGSSLEPLTPPLWQVLLNCTAEAVAGRANLQLSATAPQRPSISFVGSSLYRNWGIYTGTVGSYVYWNSSSVRGAIRPTAVQLVYVRVRWVDPATGYASTPETIALTF